MDLGLFNKLVDGSVGGSPKQWLSTVAVVKGNRSIGSPNNILKGCFLKIATEFRKASVIVRDLVGKFA